jgi:predicted metal-dependent hydrolase
MFPFQYRIRESTRAKQLQLRISERHGLEVIIPKRLKSKIDVYAFLDKKRDWIQKHLEKQQETIASTPTNILPDQLILRGIEEDWSVAYLANKGWELLENPFRQLTLLGDTCNILRCYVMLTSWLKRKAEVKLGNWLSQLSQETDLPFRRFQIRAQQTRWGSCSSDGDICLNYQLLFLPSPLVRHILLHELAHTRYLHHGVRFWDLLKKLDDNTVEHAYQAKRASHYVPRWVFASRV